MRAKYKGYEAIQRSKVVHICKDGVEEKTLVGDKDYSVKELRTLINKHIKSKVGGSND